MIKKLEIIGDIYIVIFKNINNKLNRGNKAKLIAIFDGGFLALFALFFYRMKTIAFCEVRFMKAKLSIFIGLKELNFGKENFI